MDKSFGNLITLVFAMVNLVIGSIVRSFVIGTLYYWYVVPLYEVDPLTMAQAFGLSVLISYISIKTKGRMEETWEEQNPLDVEEKIAQTVGTFIKIFLIGGFMLLLGWIGTYFL